jgi:hypothetical protein
VCVHLTMIGPIKARSHVSHWMLLVSRLEGLFPIAAPWMPLIFCFAFPVYSVAPATPVVKACGSSFLTSNQRANFIWLVIRFPFIDEGFELDRHQGCINCRNSTLRCLIAPLDDSLLCPQTDSPFRVLYSPLVRFEPV